MFADFSACFAALSAAFSALSAALSAAFSALSAALSALEFPEELDPELLSELDPLSPLSPLSPLPSFFAKAIDPNSSIPVILLTTILLVTEYEKIVAKVKIKAL